MSDWISVEYSHPSFNECVIVYRPSWKGQPVTTGWLKAINSQGLKFIIDDCDNYSITHWMPLPEPPKGE